MDSLLENARGTSYGNPFRSLAFRNGRNRPHVHDLFDLIPFPTLRGISTFGTRLNIGKHSSRNHVPRLLRGFSLHAPVSDHITRVVTALPRPMQQLGSSTRAVLQKWQGAWVTTSFHPSFLSFSGGLRTRHCSGRGFQGGLQAGLGRGDPREACVSRVRTGSMVMSTISPAGASSAALSEPLGELGL